MSMLAGGRSIVGARLTIGSEWRACRRVDESRRGEGALSGSYELGERARVGESVRVLPGKRRRGRRVAAGSRVCCSRGEERTSG